MDYFYSVRKMKGTNVYKYRRYQCVGKQSHYKRMVGYSETDIGLKCDTPNYEVDKLESDIVQRINDLKFNFESLKTQKNTNVFELKKSHALNEEINTTENKLSKLVDLYLNEKIDLTIYENKKNEYDLKISLLKKEDEALKKDNKYLNNEEAKNIVNRFDSKNISYDEQKKIVKMLINKIEVAPDKLTVYWNF